MLVELWLSYVPVELRSRSIAGTCSTSDLQAAIFGVLFLEYVSNITRSKFAWFSRMRAQLDSVKYPCKLTNKLQKNVQ